MSNGTDSAATLTLPYAAASGFSPAKLTVTQRNFLKAVVYTFIIVFFFWCAYYVERNVLNRSPASTRYIGEASEAAMRYITIPHIIIGFLFLVSSKNNRTAKARGWTVGLLITGVVLCLLYYRFGGRTDLALSVGVYFYFLVHELRDEAMFYTVLGDAAPIPDKLVFKRFVRWMTGLIVCSLAALLLASAPFGLFVKKLTASETGFASLGLANTAWFNGSLPMAWKIVLSIAPVLLVSLGYVYALKKYARQFGFKDVRSFMVAHRNLFFVMFGVAAVLGLVIFVTFRFYALILFHVVAWYVFASYQFKKHPPKEPPKGLWLWMRTTLSGFRTLHIGMALVLMAVGFVWTISYGQHPSFYWLLAPESFLYWTIMHITVSFVPR